MAKASDTATPLPALYGEDLAWIHVDGHGFHWTGAADAILAWFCFARIEEDHRQNTLTRYITTFRRLRELGFRVQTRRSYGDYALGARQAALFCRTC